MGPMGRAVLPLEPPSPLLGGLSQEGSPTAGRSDAFTLEVQKRILSRKLAQISYLLEVFGRVSSNPSDASPLQTELLRPTVVMSPSNPSHQAPLPPFGSHPT
eukprot:RCo030617